MNFNYDNILILIMKLILNTDTDIDTLNDLEMILI